MSEPEEEKEVFPLGRSGRDVGVLNTMGVDQLSEYTEGNASQAPQRQRKEKQEGGNMKDPRGIKL